MKIVFREIQIVMIVLFYG